eukprot:gene23539-9063_t
MKSPDKTRKRKRDGKEGDWDPGENRRLPETEKGANRTATIVACIISTFYYYSNLVQQTILIFMCSTLDNSDNTSLAKEYGLNLGSSSNQTVQQAILIFMCSTLDNTDNTSLAKEYGLNLESSNQTVQQTILISMCSTLDNTDDTSLAKEYGLNLRSRWNMNYGMHYYEGEHLFQTQ